MDADPARLPRILRTLWWRCRFLVAAICCGLAATATVHGLRPPPPPTTAALVTVRDIQPGEQIEPEDVATVDVPAELAPDGLLDDPDAAAGRTPVVALPAGLPLHAALVTGGEVASRAPDGTVVVPVRLADSGWLRPGDRIDLLAADDAGTRLARRALVLPSLTETGAEGDSPGGGLLGPGPRSGSPELTLVAVAPREAQALAAASGWGAVIAVLVG